jgi:general stress protein YciG
LFFYWLQGFRGISVAARLEARTVRGARDWNLGMTQVGGTVAKEDRGFASMDRSKQRDIASKGGKAAHQKGTAHEWTSEEAREAGRKGGMASHRRKQQGDGSPENVAGAETMSEDVNPANDNSQG